MKIPEFYRLKNHPLLPPMPGANGPFLFPHYRIKGYEIFCMVSDGLGWEHVSVPVKPIGKDATRCPTWEEMCWVKDQFWEKDACVVQYHPAAADYVSCHPYCLHLWRPTKQVLPTPSSIMVGPSSSIKKQ